MTVLWGADVFVLGIMETLADKLSLWYEVLWGADVFVLGKMGAPSGKLSLWYDNSMGSGCLCPWYNGEHLLVS